MAASIAFTIRYGRRLVSPATRAISCRWQSSSTSSSSHVHHHNKEFEDQTLNTPLPSPDPENPPLMERSDKGFFARLFDKYSLSQQTNRILVAESFLQAATRQASDP